MAMKITYIAHSGFCVELEKHVLLFDYLQESFLRGIRRKQYWYLLPISIRTISA